MLDPPTLPIALFTQNPWPRWVFALPGATVTFELFAADDAAGTVLRWAATPKLAATLDVRLLLSGRDYHALHHHNPAFDFTPIFRAGAGGAVAWRPYATLPAIAALGNFTYTHDPAWYFNFRYAQETARGLDDTEDLASPGRLTFDLSEDAVLLLRPGDGLSLRPAAHAATLAAAERARRRRDPAPAAFLADRPPGRTLIAGFPWFTDWGRDTFIALRGLCHTTGRLAEAGAILRAWAPYADAGMLPNRFPDQGETPEYTSVDAALWFIVAAHAHLAAAPDDAASRAVLPPVILALLAALRAGTRHRIGMDNDDALLAAGVPNLQLTWMDAIAGGAVVTPRIGKPVEVNALWINALDIGAAWDPACARLAARARASFGKFHNPAGGLYDVIDAGHDRGKKDPAIRPNQIFAAGGLPFPILTGAAAQDVLETVRAHLLTPMGLRTLAPTDPAYCPRYEGGPEARDRAYHQGTVWPWLIAAFTDAHLAVHGRTPEAKAHAAAFLAPLAAHRAQNGGHIAEIADAEPPHTPRGCPAQAWSLGEFLRARALCGLPP